MCDLCAAATPSGHPDIKKATGADIIRTNRLSVDAAGVLKWHAVEHVVIYQLFIECYSGRILVHLDMNNKHPKEFAKKWFLNVYIINYIMVCIIWEVKISKYENHSKWGPKRC